MDRHGPLGIESMITNPFFLFSIEQNQGFSGKPLASTAPQRIEQCAKQNYSLEIVKQKVILFYSLNRSIMCFRVLQF
jgi:hypothetical protein